MGKTRYEREGVELEDVFYTLEKYVGKYLHFTSADKLGINTRPRYPGLNPVGIYGYEISDRVIERLRNNDIGSFESNMQSVSLYQNMFIFDFIGKALDVRGWGFFEKRPLIDKIDKSEIQNKHLATNIILRSQGYSALKGFITSGDRDEVCVLDPTKLIVLDKLRNPIFDKKRYEQSQEWRKYLPWVANHYMQATKNGEL